MVNITQPEEGVCLQKEGIQSWIDRNDIITVTQLVLPRFYYY